MVLWLKKSKAKLYNKMTLLNFQKKKRTLEKKKKNEKEVSKKVKDKYSINKIQFNIKKLLV